jgi:hypothetical protein
MNIDELNQWIETPEGKQWIESQKKGLLDKQAELLEKVTKGNADNKTLNERIESLESELSKNKAVINDTLLSKPLTEKLNAKGVFPVLLPELVKRLSETYGFTIQDGNAAGKMTVDGKETVLTLDQAIEHWSASDQAKDCFKPLDLKTQSTTPDFKGSKPIVDAEYNAARIAAGLAPMENNHG